MRRWLPLAGIVVIASIALIVVGRQERSSEEAYQLEGIANVRTLIGTRIDQPADYRYGSGLWCLIYPKGGRVFALELCVNGSGSLVEAVDRRGSVSRFYSVVDEPIVADTRLDPLFVREKILQLQNKAAAR